MKILHTLKASWLITAMLVAVVVGETIAWQVSRMFDLRFAPVAVAAICIGGVAALVAWIYDGKD